MVHLHPHLQQKKFSMSLSENMSNIMHKGKHPFYFLKGTTRVSTSWTVGDDSSSIVDLTQDLLPKKIQNKKREFNQMFQDVCAIKFIWAKIIIGHYGKMTQVRCTICNQ